MTPRLLTKHEVAEMYRVPVSHVTEKCRKRLVEFTWRGREYGFTEAQARAFAASFPVVQPKAAAPRPPRKTARKAPEPKPAPVPKPRASSSNTAGVPTANRSVSRLYRTAAGKDA